MLCSGSGGSEAALCEGGGEGQNRFCGIEVCEGGCLELLRKMSVRLCREDVPRRSRAGPCSTAKPCASDTLPGVHDALKT